MSDQGYMEDAAKDEPRWIREPGIGKGWRTAWNLKDQISEDDSPAATASAARIIHQRLEKYRMKSWNGRWAEDDEIEQISDEFHTIGFVDGDEDADAGHFNVVLNGLYDWADEERVIIR